MQTNLRSQGLAQEARVASGIPHAPGLAAAWDAATKSDLLRLLDRDAEMDRRETERFHRVQDSVASRVAGHPIDTSDVKGDGMDVSVDSPETTTTTITNNYPAQPPPLSNSFLSGVLGTVLGLLVASLVATLLVLSYVRPPTTIPTPPPVTGETGYDVDISVR